MNRDHLGRETRAPAGAGKSYNPHRIAGVTLLVAMFLLCAGCIAESSGSTPRRRSVYREPVVAARPAAEAVLPEAAAPLALAKAAAGTGLRLIAWNMEWLADEPGRGTLKRAVSDYSALAGYAAEIDPDIAVLQEVAGEEAVQRVFDSSRYHIYVTQETGVQRVALVWKKGIDLNVVDELEELGPGGLRESPDALVTVPGGSFRLLGVHLKSSCFSDNLVTTRKDACITLRGQMDIVEAWMEARQAEGTPFAVLGDFNRRFSDRDDAWADLNDDTPAGFKLVAPTVGRTARCRDGRYKDFIDHIVMSDSLARRMVPGSFQQWNYRSWDPPVLSDHCPIGVNLR
ncbi:MAG: hypothetical protein HQ461_09310 [Deltaproteobacteria bacterium]|nr:hypothetical protein [Deltaproteobacteria bacterium]